MLLAFEGFDWPVAATNPTNDYVFGAMLQSGQSGWQSGPGGGNSKVAGQIAGSAWNTIQGWIAVSPGSNYSTIIIGARIKLSATNSVCTIFDLRDTAGVQGGVACSASGKLFYWRGSNATVVGVAGNTVLVAGNWYYIELKVTFSNTGSFEIRLDGVTETSGSGVDTTNTANNFVSTCFLFPNHSTTSVSYDDFYFCDTSGSVANDFLGPCRVETLRPASNDSVQWTPLSSTNASNVDDPDHDSDSTYNSDTVAGHIDTFNMTDLSSSPVTIFGVDVLAIMRKTDVAARTGRPKLISGSTTANGATVNLQSGYVKMREMYLLNPDGNVAWTPAAVNALKAGYELVA